MSYMVEVPALSRIASGWAGTAVQIKERRTEYGRELHLFCNGRHRGELISDPNKFNENKNKIINSFRHTDNPQFLKNGNQVIAAFNNHVVKEEKKYQEEMWYQVDGDISRKQRKPVHFVIG